MNCERARARLAEARAGTLPETEAAELAAHLEGCAACRHEDAAQRLLTDALQRRLPRHKAPASLVRRLERDVTRTPQRARSRTRFRVAAAAVAIGLLLAVSFVLDRDRSRNQSARATAELQTEAVNDHLRILYSEHPIEIESGGIHQVKPWFQGRLDFAPVMPFAGDDDFPLQGGAVSYFIDRKAAAFVFKRRLHTISVLVFRADGFAWPSSGLVPVGRVHASKTRLRGFNVLLFRDGELGYALVSDVDPADLTALAVKIAPG